MAKVRTVLSCLKSALRQLVVGLAGCADHYELYLGVCEHCVERVVDDDAFRCLLSKACLKFAARTGGLPFHDGMEGE